MTDLYVVPDNILGSLMFSYGGGGKAVLRTKIALSSIDIATVTLPKKSFSMGVVLDC